MTMVMVVVYVMDIYISLNCFPLYIDDAGTSLLRRGGVCIMVGSCSLTSGLHGSDRYQLPRPYTKVPPVVVVVVVLDDWFGLGR